MNKSAGSEFSWLIAVICVFAWVVILSFALSYIFGVNFSAGWLIAGTMFSIAAFFGMLMVREISEAILSFPIFLAAQRPKQRIQKKAQKQKRRPVATSGPGVFAYSSFAGTRREDLGLRSGEISSNKHRSKSAKQSRTSKRRRTDPLFDRQPLFHTPQLS